jgi:hypothetical protein
MPNSNVIASAAKQSARKDTFTHVGKKTKCQHISTKFIEGFDRCTRGRIDVELCEDCDKVLSRKVVR